MNKLNPDNLIFVPKNRFTNFVLGCSTSLLIITLGFLVALFIYQIVENIN